MVTYRGTFTNQVRTHRVDGLIKLLADKNRSNDAPQSETGHQPMQNKREFVFLTPTGRRLPTWLRVWLTISVVAAGAVLLWLGLVLALAVVLAAALALLPIWAWRMLTANRHSGGPATIEGDYTISTPPVIEARDEAPDRNPTGDADPR